MNININEPAGVLVKTTLVDFPGLVACSFFLPGCNLRCPYCYNGKLAQGALPQDTSTVSIEQLFQHLEKRKNVLQGICISGGEALLSPKLPLIIKKAKALGYKVKLDTNGTLPKQLKALLSSTETEPDFIAMDIKTWDDQYTQLLPGSTRAFLIAQITESINELKKLPTERREFRTVLVPSLIDKNCIEKIARVLPKDSSWQFAQFRNENCLDPEYNNVIPYSDKEIQELVHYAQNLIPGAKLR